MILPDDKNPTIVWDKERKCWTNTEGNAEETESFKPPPKMSDMGGVAAAVVAAAAAPPALNTLGTIPTPLATPNLLPQQQQHELPPVNLYEGNQSTIEYDYNNYTEQVQQYAPVPAPATPAAAPVRTLTATPGPALAASTPAPSAAAAAAAAAGPQPKLQSNMFKIQRNRSKCLDSHAYLLTAY